MLLVEIHPGTWVRPERVTAVRTYTGGPHPFKKDAEPLPPSVQIMMADVQLAGWEFDTHEGAKAWAAMIAKAINAALATPEE